MQRAAVLVQHGDAGHAPFVIVTTVTTVTVATKSDRARDRGSFDASPQTGRSVEEDMGLTPRSKKVTKNG